MRTLRIQTEKPYDVQVGRGMLYRIGALLRERIRPCRMAVIADEKVFGIYGKTVLAALHREGFDPVAHTFPPGEASKNAATLITILEFLGGEGLTRADCVLALGGGVTGDIAGLAASLYLRGIRYVQLPTTLLAMVDSSVGGKTAIDLNAGKNLVGAFHQPIAVFCDGDALSTLPEREYRAGLAECVKYGAIADAALLASLSASNEWQPPAMGGEANDIRMSNILQMIARCIAIKEQIVAGDEFDTGGRRLLNFGHTPGHAIEKLSDYAILHGEAVAMGMALMARAAYRRGICDQACRDAILGAIVANRLPTGCWYSAGQLAGAALCDKKREGNSIALILPAETGRCVVHKLPVGELDAFFEAGKEK